MSKPEPPEVSREDLARAFERMCKTLGKTSRAFDVNAIDGPHQWAMMNRDGLWMIVSGLGGCGAAVSRRNGYVQGDWNFLMLIEAIEIVTPWPATPSTERENKALREAMDLAEWTLNGARNLLAKHEMPFFKRIDEEMEKIRGLVGDE